MSKKKKNKLIKLTVWSNFFLLIPIGLAFYYRLYIYAGVILLAMIISTFYHYYDEKRFVLIDQITATGLIIANIITIYLANFPEPFFTACLLFTFTAMYCKERTDNYRLFHSLWHFSGIIVTILCVLAYKS